MLHVEQGGQGFVLMAEQTPPLFLVREALVQVFEIQMNMKTKWKQQDPLRASV